jgi:DNA polymerase III alpha subunit
VADGGFAEFFRPPDEPRETIKLIKIDLLGLGMLAAIDETVQLIEHDCAVCVDLDRLPEEIPEVFAML